METKKCKDCKFYAADYNPSIVRLGKTVHGICLKYNESLTFVEACDEYEEKKEIDSQTVTETAD